MTTSVCLSVRHTSCMQHGCLEHFLCRHNAGSWLGRVGSCSSTLPTSQPNLQESRRQGAY